MLFFCYAALRAICAIRDYCHAFARHLRQLAAILISLLRFDADDYAAVFHATMFRYELCCLCCRHFVSADMPDAAAAAADHAASPPYALFT